jgi:hypothetical protein
MTRLAAAAGTLIGLAAALSAGGATAAERAVRRLDRPLVLLPKASPDCTAGLVYDDGGFEAPYRVAGASPLDLVMGFDLPPTAAQLSQICLCWTRTGGADSVDFDLLVFDDGAGGQPGDLLAGLGGLQAVGVPFFPQVAFYSFNLSALGIPLPPGRIFVGPSWDTEAQPDVAQCGDEDGPSFRPLFYSTDQGATWEDFGGLAPDLRALGIRTEATQGTPFTCQPDATTLCLNGGRFQVRLTWRRPPNQGGGLEDAHTAAAGTDDSGLFYFQNPDNWEMLIKVLRACGLNQRYWVFFAATTDVEYTVTVADSATGASKQYTNPAGVPSPAVTDTGAFATCP